MHSASVISLEVPELHTLKGIGHGDYILFATEHHDKWIVLSSDEKTIYVVIKQM